MSDSLRDQLLKAGLVTKQQVNQAERQQARDRRPAKSAGPPKVAAAVQAANAAKTARDREMERSRQTKAAARARAAEISQLIDQHRLPPVEGDEYFNFIAGKKIRRIAINGELRERLARGAIAIVRHEGRSALVPADIAARIADRDPRAVISAVAASSTQPADEGDPYREFVVPDDLHW